MHRTRRLCGISIVTAWVLFLAPAAQSMPAPGDMGPTDPAVTSNTGAARFQIPIAVPPGPGGFAPKVGLSYSSRSGDGPFGVGWSSRIPDIYCSSRFGIPDFANCTKYEIAGTLLVKDPATQDEYHTFVESFNRIRYVPAGDYWTVEVADGNKLFFGQLTSHRISQGGYTARWLLQRTEDAFGNSIFFEYDTATDVGTAYPSAIFYGGSATRTSGPREVRFVYEDRPDGRHVFTGGVEQKMTRRLREIQVFGHGVIFRRHVFGYDRLQGVSNYYRTDRSRLSWVQEFGTDCADLTLDPVVSCNGMPPREFDYTRGWSSGNYDPLRIPLGGYPGHSPNPAIWKQNYPQLIGDINGDGLPDRIQFGYDYKLDYVARIRVFINTVLISPEAWSETDASAVIYKQSFESLTYNQPGFDYVQIPAGVSGHEWFVDLWYDEGTMNAMCSVTPTSRVATLSQELRHDGIEAATTGLWPDLLASAGSPFAGSIEPRPSVKLVDINSDGLADLVLSVRLGGLKRHFDCDGMELATPEEIPALTVSIVFRNTGSGWINDAEAQALAEGLPPFEEVIAKSSYQTELEEPSTYYHRGTGQGEDPRSPCGYSSYFGYEQDGYSMMGDTSTTICHVPIDLAPKFTDFNGDGFLDLAVLVRDDPDLLWTGERPQFLSGWNNANTRVWIQDPEASPRWIRAPQYDSPVPHVALMHIWNPEMTAGYSNCNTWNGSFKECGPPTFAHDFGTRLVDINGDGLTDVVWSGGSYRGSGGYEGVLLNTGSGSNEFSAWCASDPAYAVGAMSVCPEAAAYVPPSPVSVLEAFFTYDNNPLGNPVGHFADLNGDGFPDFVRVQWNDQTTESWIQSPGGATAASVWRRDSSFDFNIDFLRPVEHPFHWEVTMLDPHPGEPFETGFIPAYVFLDITGNGIDDLVGDQYAFISVSAASDLISSAKNGHGGEVLLSYSPTSWLRSSVLETYAELDAQQPGTPEGGNATRWRPTPVVQSVTVTGSGFADEVTTYLYARPRYCTNLRSDLGFRLVERVRPDNTSVEEYFYQDHGRAGRLSRRLVKDGGAEVHRYQANWDQVASTVLGTIPEVYNARLVSEDSANQYAGQSGAIGSRTLTYDDDHGYNFVSSIRTVRSTGVLIDARTPDSDFAAYVVGRNATRTLTDGLTGDTVRDTVFTYLDLDGDSTGAKLGSRSENIFERGPAQSNWVNVENYRYDNFGNLTEEQTPSPTGSGSRSTLHCYDGDAAWCPSPAGQSSHSVRVATKDPLLNITQFTPDKRSGIIVGVDSDYTDEPATRITLDPFGRLASEYVTPTGDSEVLVADTFYYDANGPLRTERFDYVDGAASDWIYSATIAGSFGGDWKTIAETPSGYVGSVTFRDAANRQTRSTLPLDCGPDPTCVAFSGQTEPAASETVSDAVGRTIRVDTPDGFSLMAYSAVAGPAPGDLGGPGPFDAVLVKNGKGDLIERVTDGDRSVWVNECSLGVASGLTSLAGVTCGTADTTVFTYEATGEIYTIYDATAVAQSSFQDANRRLRYGFDTLGRVVRIEDPDLEGTGFTATTFNDAGIADSTTNARGDLSSFTYDILGRLTGVTTPSGQDDYTVTYRTTELQREQDSSGFYTRLRTYDGWGRVKQTQLGVLEGGVLYNYLTDYDYDLVGRIVEVLHPESTTIRYEYEGAFLKRVCDLGTAADCSDSGVVAYVSDVTYDGLGRRTDVASDAGIRTFTYDGSLPRLLQDRFDGSSDPYWFERNYTARDELGNVKTITGGSLPADIDLNASFTYDSRNRLDSWTKDGMVHDYGYDELGNLTLHAGNAQLYDDANRPHAIKSRVNGNATYGYDPDGNVTSIVATGNTQYFTFNAANRLVCIDDSVANGCGVSRIHYDVDGQRVLDDKPSNLSFVAYVDESVRIHSGLPTETRIEISAFGERIAFKRTTDPMRSAAILPFTVPPAAPLILGILGLASLLAWAQRRGELELIIDRPLPAGVSAVLVVALVLYPVPPVRAGGGGGATFYWQLADYLGTGMVLLDETGARVVHRTYSPFGVEHASVGSAAGGWMLRNYAGHLVDEDSGLVYMNARWMDPASGVFLSVDPLVPNAADPQSYNAYAYARNNPVNAVDPTGMFWSELGWLLNFLSSLVDGLPETRLPITFDVSAGPGGRGDGDWYYFQTPEGFRHRGNGRAGNSSKNVNDGTGTDSGESQGDPVNQQLIEAANKIMDATRASGETGNNINERSVRGFEGKTGDALTDPGGNPNWSPGIRLSDQSHNHGHSPTGDRFTDFQNRSFSPTDKAIMRTNAGATFGLITPRGALLRVNVTAHPGGVGNPAIIGPTQVIAPIGTFKWP